jgi:hypothetical protein
MRPLMLGTVLSVTVGVTLAVLPMPGGLAQSPTDDGFVSLFNGKDLTGWKIPAGDNGHWKVVDGVIDYDAKSEAEGSKDLWTEKSYKDFILKVDWRLKLDPGMKNRVAVIDSDGNPKKDEKGQPITVEIDDVDSGIYLRGTSKAQVNIWMWPVGSGEVWGYRTDPKMPPEVRRAVTPLKKADRPRGEWNTFEISLVGEILNVKLNGEVVIKDARLPGVPKEGPIALQHHGNYNAQKGVWTGSPSLVQFKNIYIKELK